MTDGFGVSAQSCTYGAWLKVHVKCTGIFSFATNVDDSCVLKRALIPSHNITIDPRYSLDLTIKFLHLAKSEPLETDVAFVSILHVRAVRELTFSVSENRPK